MCNKSNTTEKYVLKGYLVDGTGTPVWIAEDLSYKEAFKVMLAVASSGKWTGLKIFTKTSI